MKRTIILLACALGIFTANAQSVVESTKFTDNWSVGNNFSSNSFRMVTKRNIIYSN